MSHYDIKFLAWLSTNWLLGRKKRKSDFAALLPQREPGIPKPPMAVERKDIFDCHRVPLHATAMVAVHGWSEDDAIYIVHEGRVRRTVLRFAEIYRTYGGEELGALHYGDMEGVGKVHFTDGFAYALTREDADASLLSRVGEREGEPRMVFEIMEHCLFKTGMTTLNFNDVNPVTNGTVTALRYRWDEAQHKAVGHPIITGSFMTEDGKTFRVSREWFEPDTFGSAQACEAAKGC